MTDNQQIDRDALFSLATALASSARGALEEGVHTASLRLADAIRRLIEAVPALRSDPFFHDLEIELREPLRRAYFMDDNEYRAFLDDLITQFALEVRRRNGLDESTVTKAEYPDRDSNPD